jgi:hypothetical protein
MARVGLKQQPRTLADYVEVQAGDFATGAVGTTALAANSVTSAKMDEVVLKTANVSLTNAMVLALRATPIELVAAPGAGKFLEFISAEIIFDYVGAYTESADNLAVKYENGSGVQVSQDIETTGFLDATADTKTNALAKINTITAKTGCENKALVLHNTGDGEFGGGNAANALRVRTAYRVHSSGW